MDPISVIILAAIYAALRGPREAGRAVRGDYRGRRDRWSTRAEPFMTRGGRGRGGRRVAGYDRAGRAYTRDRRDGRGDPGWRRDSKAWRGPEGRARVARGIRPSAIRAGIATGALAYTALFGAGVAARGFARGTRGGYRMGRAHYRAKRNQAAGPTFTVTPGAPGDQVGPDAETVYAVIVDDDPPSPGPRRTAPGADDRPPIGIVHPPRPEEDRGEGSGAGWVITVVDTRRHVGPGKDDFEVVDRITVTDPAELRRRMADIAATPYLWGFPSDLRDGAAPPEPAQSGPASPVADMKNGPWLLVVHGPGVNRFTGGDSEGVAVYDAADLDRRLAVIADVPGLSAEVRPLPDPDADLASEDSRPQDAAGSINPGGSSVSNNITGWIEVNGDGNDVVTNSIAGSVTDSNIQMGGGSGAQIINTAAGSNVGIQLGAVDGGSVHVTTGPGGATVTTGGVSRHVSASGGISAVSVAAGGGGYSISAPTLMEGANYDAHLHNLNVIAKEARAEYSSAELTLASASAARQRAEHAMSAVEQMAAGLAAQDFGETHVGNMASLHEMLSRHVAQARAAERAASESLATSEQLIAMCVSAAAVFQRDHGQLAEAHANAPHAAKTREAYQPL